MTPPGGSARVMAYQDATQDRRVEAGNDRMAYNQLGLTSQGTNNGLPHTTWWVRDNEGTLISQLKRDDAPSSRYYVFDGLGSVAGLTDSGGGLAGTYSFDPYGKQVSAEPGDERSSFNPWRYASGYLDKPTGFTKFGTRYYDPTVMRWTQRDPVGGSLGNPTSLSPHQYAGCSPTNFVDPSGRVLADSTGYGSASPDDPFFGGGGGSQGGFSMWPAGNVQDDIVCIVGIFAIGKGVYDVASGLAAGVAAAPSLVGTFLGAAQAAGGAAEIYGGYELANEACP